MNKGTEWIDMPQSPPPLSLSLEAASASVRGIMADEEMVAPTQSKNDDSG
jgi:hypothetical protein